MIASVAECMVSKVLAKETAVTDTSEIHKDAFAATGNWTREQSKLAFYFYCQTPFAQLHGKNKNVIELAKLIGRTPGAVAMKCTNFASLDPAIIASGRTGLSNASNLDREIWNEFHADWERLAVECEELHRYLLREHGVKDATPSAPASDFALADFTGETRTAIVQQRLKQHFFRRAVLSSYRGRCCISGVSEPRLLVASHIVPWSEDKVNRLNPSNGLCLSAIHDKAFDAHLFTLDEDFRLILSSRLKATKDTFLRDVFWRVDGAQIVLPERFAPMAQFLDRHRETTLA